MNKLKIVYMGTPDFAVPCLDKLVQEAHEILAVVTQPDRPKGRGRKLAPSPVKEAAIRHELPVLQPEKIKTPEFVAELKALNPDIIIVVAFGQILSSAILELPKLGCINVHASLLPAYRGAAPIHWAVINGEQVTGVTTMYMDVGLDTGDMILKEEIPISADQTTGELYEQLNLLGAELLAKTIELIATGEAPRTVQDNSQASYAKLLTRETESINWQASAQQVHNLVRGLNPWPGAYCHHDGKNLKVWRTRVESAQTVAGKPGQVVVVGEHSFKVATVKGVVEILEVQPESKKRMSAGEYVRGYGLNVGEILG
ncbi:MAG: Methionyl-tRNA formyltransferase [Firmicutes bacterium]|nr:Methionyl-tRNA formyltransferase [Bacillota bacterium]